MVFLWLPWDQWWHGFRSKYPSETASLKGTVDWIYHTLLPTLGANNPGLAIEHYSWRYPKVVQARSIFCYWAIRELGITAEALANRIGLTPPAIGISAKRGEQIVKEKALELETIFNRFMN